MKIQKSTRTTIPRLGSAHDYCRMKFGWYYRWHLNKYANTVHIAGVFVFALLTFVISITALNPHSQKSMVMAGGQNGKISAIRSTDGSGQGVPNAGEIPLAVKENELVGTPDFKAKLDETNTYIESSVGSTTNLDDTFWLKSELKQAINDTPEVKGESTTASDSATALASLVPTLTPEVSPTTAAPVEDKVETPKDTNAETVKNEKIEWKDTFQGVDIKQELYVGKVKETVTVKDKDAPTTFVYNLSASDGISYKEQDGNILFIKDDEEVARILKPVTKDGNGKDIAFKYTLDGATLTLQPDQDLSNIAYPLSIDPTYSIVGGAGATSTYSSAQRKLVRDSSGNLYAVYFRVATKNNIFISKSTDNGQTWSETALTTDTTYDQYHPSIAIDSNNYIHVAWYGTYSGSTTYNQIRYIDNTSGSWGTIQNLTSGNYSQGTPSIAIDSNNYIHVVWHGTYSGSTVRQIRYINNTSGSWGAIQTLTSGGVYDGYFDPSIAIDSNNYIHMVFNGRLTKYYRDIYYIEYTNAWGTIQQLTSSTEADYQLLPSIAIDSNNNLHVVWCGVSYLNSGNFNWQIRYINNIGGSWGAIQDLTSDAYYQYYPSIAIDSNNYIHVAWYGTYSGSTTYNQIRYAEYTNAWQTIQNLTTASANQGHPSLIWANQPTVAGVKTNRAKDGYAFVWMDDTTVSFYSSSDLAWDAPAFAISGTAKQYDESTNAANSETVKVAVNGTIQAQTSTTASGAWSITGVTAPASGDTVTVFIDGVADGLEAVGVTKYDGTGDITDINLFEKHLSLGSADNQTLSNADIAKYDNSISTDEDIFFEVDASNNLTLPATNTQTDTDQKLIVKAGNTYRPASSGAVTSTVPILTIPTSATVTMDANTLILTGIGTPLSISGTFTANTSTVKYTGAGNTTIAAATYNNLETSPSAAGAGGYTYTLTGATMNFAVANGTDYIYGGVYGGRNYYHSSATGYYIYWASSDGQWSFSTGMSPGSDSLLNNTGTSPDPPRTTDGAWFFAGDGGAPTVTRVANPSTYTFTFASGTVNVAGNYVSGNGTNAVITNADTNDPTLNIDGNFTNSASSTFIQSATGTFSVAKNFTNASGATYTKGGTLTFDGDSAGIFTDSSSPLQNFGTVAQNKTSATETNNKITLASSMTVDKYDVDPTAGSKDTLDLASAGYTLTIMGSGTGASKPFEIGNGTMLGNTSSTVEYKSTSATTVANNPTYNNLKFSGATTFTPAGSTTVSGVFTIGTGATFDASSYTLTLSGGGTPFVKTGTFTASTSTVKYTAPAITNITAATYNNLETSPSGTNCYSYTFSGAGTATVNGTYTPSGSIDAGGRNLYQKSPGGPYIIWSTSFNAWSINGGSDISTYYTNASTAKNPDPPLTSDAVWVNPGWSGTNPVPTVTRAASACPYIFASGTINVTGNYVSGDGTNAVTTNADINDPTLNIDGNFTNSASSTFVASATGTFTNAGSWTNSGTFTNSSGRVTFDAGTTGKTLAGTMTGASAFNNLTFNNAAGGWTLSNDITVASVLTITAGTLDASSKTITLSGTGTPFVKTGTFTASTSTVIYTNTATVTATTFNNLTLSNATSSAQTATVAAGTLTVGGALSVVATSTGGETVNFNTNNPTVNVTGNITGTKSSSGQPAINFGTGTWTTSGSNDFSLITITAPTNSTVIMNGVNKYVFAAGQTFYNLQISGNTNMGNGAESSWKRPFAINGTLTIDASKILNTDSNSTITMNAGSTTTINGTLGTSGLGSVKLYDTAVANLSTTGTIAMYTELHAVTADITIPARTYWRTQVYNDSASARTATFGTAPGQTINFGTGDGWFYVRADGAGDMTLDASVHNPNVLVGNSADGSKGNMAFGGTGAGTERLKAGSGTWTINGNLDWTGGTLDAGTSTFAFATPSNTNNPTITSAGQSFKNVTVSTARTVTFNDATSITGTLTDTTNDSHIAFKSGATHVVNTMNVAGTAGHLIYLQSTDTSGWTFNPATISAASYLNVSRSTNIGTSICAGYSTDGLNNSGWLFSTGATCVPTTPTNVAIGSIDSTLFTTTWTDNSSDETGFKVFISTTANADCSLATYPGTADYTAAAGATSQAVTGKSINTQYCAKVIAAGSGGDSNPAYSAPKYTLANVPNAPTVNATSTTSLTAIIDANNNPATTQFAIYNQTASQYVQANGTLGASAVWQTRTQWGGDSGIINTGLTVNTSNSYQVKARDGENTETALSSGTSKYTLANAPTSAAADSKTTTGINWSWNASSNPGTTLFYASDSAGNSGWTTATTWNQTGLAINTSYTLTVKAKNGDSVETTTATISGYTLANQPSAPTVSGDYDTTNGYHIDVSINTNSNPAGTNYWIQSSTNGTDFSDPTGMAWQTGTAYTLSNLSANTQYWFKVKAKNGEATETSYSSAGADVTAPAAPINLSSSNICTTTTSTSWGASTGADKYTFSYGTDTNATNLGTTADILATSKNLTSLSNNTPYYFMVSATSNANGTGAYSAIANFTTGSCTAPIAPSDFAGSAASVSQINWSWTDSASDETGWRVENTSHTNLSNALDPGSTGWNETGLSANTSYTRHANAYNANGSNDSNQATVYTLANVPSAPTATRTGSNSINVVINANSNPALTHFAIKETNSGKYVRLSDGTLQTSQDWQTYSIWGGANGVSITGLLANTAYKFAVMAANENAMRFDGGGAPLNQLTTLSSEATETTYSTYTVTINTTGNGSGTLDQATQTVNWGSSLTINASPAGSSNFTSFTGCDSAGNSTCNLTNITANKTVTATFTLKTYSVTIGQTGNGTGTLDQSTQTVNYGTNLTVNATADISSNFIGWSGDASGTGTATLTNITSDKSITATFTLKTFAVTVASSGSGSGTFSAGSSIVNYGADFATTATANIDSNFISFAGCDSTSGADNSTCNLTNITANKTLTATFALIPTATISINGGAARTKDTTVNLTMSTNTATDMKISNLSNLSDESYQSFSTSNNNWALANSGSDGTKTIYLKVRDQYGKESQVYSSSITLDTTALSAPSALAAVAGDKTISLSWTNPSDSDFTYAKVYRGTTAGFDLSSADKTFEIYNGGATYVDPDVTNNTNYFYKVTAIDDVGNESSVSNEVTGRADSDNPTTPGKPTVVEPTQVINGDTVATAKKLTFNWTPASTDQNSGLKNYLVSIGSTSGKNDIINGQTVDPASTSFSYEFSSDGTYYIRVYAIDNTGNLSASSDELVLVIDTTAPSDTSSATMYDVSDRADNIFAAAIAWKSSTDATAGIKGYIVSKNGTSLSLDSNNITQGIVTDEKSGYSFYLDLSSPDTKASYSVKAIDKAGNAGAEIAGKLADTELTRTTGQKAGDSFITLPNFIIGEGKLEISNIKVEASGVVSDKTQAKATWDSTVPSTSLVEYGTSTAYDKKTDLDTGLNSSHTMILSDLAPATTYHFRVISKDKHGNEISSSDQSFVTGNKVKKKSILDLISETLTNSLGRIWNGMKGIFSMNPDTTYAADSTFNDLKTLFVTDISTPTQSGYAIYWPKDKGSASIQRSEADGGYSTIGTTDQNFYLDLSTKAGVSYAYKVGDLTGVSGDELSGKSTISNIKIESGTISRDNASVIITFKTDKLAKSQVLYGEGSSLSSTTTLDNALNQSHTILIENLKPNANYGFQLKSVDKAGSNTTQSEIQKFATGTALHDLSLFEIIVKALEDAFKGFDTWVKG